MSGEPGVLYVARLAAVAVGAFFCCVLLFAPPLLAHRLLHPGRLEPVRTPAAASLAYEEVEFRGRDVVLRGWYVPGHGNHGVVLVHGFPGERSDLLALVPALHAAGFHVLLYDQRAAGRSEGEMVTFGYLEAPDLEAAADYLRRRGELRAVGAFGASFGASVALMAAGRGAALDAVVADSPFADLETLVAEGAPGKLFGPLVGLATPWLSPLMLRHAEWQSGLRAADARPLDAVAGISPRPLLLIHGLADTLYSYQHSVSLYERAGEPKALWLVPGAPHARARERDRRAYDRRIVQFFLDALQPPATAAPPVGRRAGG
jgi:alpha-beta hydrolase superfamily lysophospholipase